MKTPIVTGILIALLSSATSQAMEHNPQRVTRRIDEKGVEYVDYTNPNTAVRCSIDNNGFEQCVEETWVPDRWPTPLKLHTQPKNSPGLLQILAAAYAARNSPLAQ